MLKTTDLSSKPRKRRKRIKKGKPIFIFRQPLHPDPIMDMELQNHINQFNRLQR